MSVLMNRFTYGNMVTKQANEYADRLIVITAFDLVCTNNSVTIVSEDVGLLVILIALHTQDNVYFLKPGRGKVLQ